jgi:hypothetical protein
MTKFKFKIGDHVNKTKGYDFPGIIVAAFTNTNKEIRYVVEMKSFGLLHIFNEEQLKYEGS